MKAECMLFLGLLALPLHAEAAAPPADLRPILRVLASEYRWLGLPEPPKGARLARQAGQLGLLYPSSDAGLVFLAGLDPVFVGHGRARNGAERFAIEEPAIRPLRADEPLLKEDIESGSLLFAVQCWLAGRRDAPLAILPQVLLDEQALKDQLRLTAYDHWREQIGHENSDWAYLAGRLRALRLIAAGWENLLDGLILPMEETIKAKPAPRGTVEALLDDLIRTPLHFAWDKTGGLGGALVPAEPSNSQFIPSPYEKLKLAGFDAVPALMKALDDKRLTRMTRFSFPSDLVRVDQTAGSLLLEIIDEATLARWERRGLLDRSQWNPTLPRKKLAAWWQKTRKKGEAAYYIGQTLAPEGSLASFPLRILSRKHPKELPRLYRELLRRRHALDGREILDALLASNLPARTKRESLWDGLSEGSAVQRVAVLKALLRQKLSFLVGLIL